jgi:hypothetical protein
MKRIVFITAVVVALAAAASAVGSDATSNAKASCTTLRAKMGLSAFASAYSSFGACVSSMAPVEQKNVTSANALCTAEQNDPTFAAGHNNKTFDQFYGDGKKGKNAFGNCVSTKAKAASQAEQQSRPNPSRSCRGLRSQMGAQAFAALYGKNATARNAYGKCVSAWARAQTHNELNAAAQCSAEQNDAAFAAAHGGKTFAQFYGTDTSLANAFGQCVSAKAKTAGQTQQRATVSAAKTCLGELNANRAAFTAKYRTFGRCVSQHATQ